MKIKNINTYEIGEVKPLLSANRTLEQLRPTAEIKNKFLLLIDKIFGLFLSWIYPFTPTHYVGIVAALDNRVQEEPLTPQEILAYLRRFYASEETSAAPAIRRCLSELEEQYAGIYNLQSHAFFNREEKEEEKPEGESVDDPLTITITGMHVSTPEELEAAPQGRFLKKWIDRVENLKEGEQCLIVGDMTLGDELFYLFSRKEGMTTLRVLGRGSTMVHLSDVEEMAAPGRNRIVSSLTCDNVDAAFIKDLLNYTPLGQRTPRHADFKPLVQSHLSADFSPLNHLSTKTENFYKTLWSSLQQVGENAGASPSVTKRAKIRLELFSLFDMLKSNRHTLEGNITQIETMQRMLKLCAQHMIKAEKQGLLTQEELEDLNGELVYVAQKLEAASQTTTPLFPDTKISVENPYCFKGITPSLVPPHSQGPFFAPVAFERRTPRLPPADRGERIVWSSQSQLKRAGSLVKRLEVLRGESPSTIVRNIFDIPFDPQVERTGLDNFQSLWRQLSSDEVQKIIPLLSALSQEIAQSMLEAHELEFDGFLALVKISYILIFLTHQQIKESHANRSLGALLIHLLLRYTEVVQVNLYGPRCGAALTPVNQSTFQELYDFYPERYRDVFHFPKNIMEARVQLRHEIPLLKPLQELCDLFGQLLPHRALTSRLFLRPFIPDFLKGLSLPWVAIYHLMNTSSIPSLFQMNENLRDVPESLYHDPQSAIEEREDFFIGNEIADLRSHIELELQNHDAIGLDFLLDRSFISKEARHERLRKGLSNLEAFLSKASQDRLDLSKEEMSALLSLASEAPQKNILRFLKTHVDLLKHPDIRTFVRLLFFDSNLLLTLKRGQNFRGNVAKVFSDVAPEFLSEAILEHKKATQADLNHMPILLFFLQINEELKAIYHTKGLNLPFFSLSDDPEIASLCAAYRTKEPLSATSIEIAVFELKRLLSQESFSQKEMVQIVCNMQCVLNADLTLFDQRDLFWIKSSYRSLLDSKADFFSTERAHYLLDQICEQKGLPLDDSEWTGDFPIFQNKLYCIDLVSGDITFFPGENSIYLPEKIAQSPLFRKNFPEFIDKKCAATLSVAADGTHLYSWQDDQHNYYVCEVQGENERLYRIFFMGGQRRLLQAVELRKGSQTEAWPSLLEGPYFIDPQDPSRAYMTGENHKILFELCLKESHIDHIIDCRAQEPSSPKRLNTLATHPIPALKALESLEEASQILIWTDDTGHIEKVEIPRYELEFKIQGGELICLTPHLAGYRAVLNASLKERRGLHFSLLLQHPDPARPKKWLLPPAHALKWKRESASNYRGLAAIIARILEVLSRILERITYTTPLRELVLTPAGKSLVYSEIDLLPHTEKLTLPQDRKLELCQELLRHALIQEREPLALEVIDSLELESDTAILRKWVLFLNTLERDQHAAALGLKLAEKLSPFLKGMKSRKTLSQSLALIERTLFKRYLQEMKRIPASLQLSSESFQKFAADLRKKEPLFYQKHILPFYLDGDETFCQPKISQMAKLERKVQPQRALSRESLAKELDLSVVPLPLLFSEEEIAPYFRDDQLDEGAKLLSQRIAPKKASVKQALTEAKGELERLLSPRLVSDHLASLAGAKWMATLPDLHLALLQNDFEGLKNRLPEDCDLKKLKESLTDYYDCVVTSQLIERCENGLRVLLEEDRSTALYRDRSAALYALLTHKRDYHPDKNPELLAFEAFHFITFRASQEVSQLQLLKELLAAQSSIIQAGTGTGKSSVLSVLRGLMRANGENLVTQKVLPHLYEETLSLLQKRLGDVFGRKIYPLRFNQSMPLYDSEGHSLFGSIYLNLLATIKNRGCVLTDYKSFVLLEQKFISLSQQIASYRLEDDKAPLPLLKHWFYLSKILILLKNRDDQLMDEFDQPMNPVQRIQTQMREGAPFDLWMIEESLALFDLLKEEKKLFLEEGLHGDIDEKTRLGCLQNVAQRLAQLKAKGSASQEDLYHYFMGESDALLYHLEAYAPEERDRLALLKEQLTTFLPLTLSRSGLSDYARSPDGKKIVTCSKGERREAKFGNPIEEINYSIQDYFQRKVALTTWREFVLASKKSWEKDPEGEERFFEQLFPTLRLSDITSLKGPAFEKLLKEWHSLINQDPQAVRFFLERHLCALRSSGVVVSMTPQDSVAMSLAVSGVSATTGSLGALHDQFNRDEATAETNQQKMLDRVKARSLGPPIRYSPHNPLALLEAFRNPQMSALIDGAGAFRNIPCVEVMKAIKKWAPHLKCIKSYDDEGRVRSIGDASAPLSQIGFYFPQAQTRGSDQVLRPDGIALQTASDRGTIEDFIQEEGRMRHPQQRILVALSDFAPSSIQSLDDLIAHKKRTEKAKHAEDRYRAEPQRLRQMLRCAARDKLLTSAPLDEMELIFSRKDLDEEELSSHLTEALDPYLKTFEELSSLFIQSLQGDTEPGSYFEKHARIIDKNSDPVQELTAYRDDLKEKGDQLKLDLTPLTLYSPETLRDSLPQSGYPLKILENQQQEVQEELEMNNELLLEEELEQDLQNEHDVKKVPFYLKRGKKDYAVPASSLHPAFSSAIKVTDNFLPLSRKDPLHKRRAFDDRTIPIGIIQVNMAEDRVEKIVIEDTLEERFQRISYGFTFFYDISLNRVVKEYYLNRGYSLESPDFHRHIAQVKFLDGRVNGYTEGEIAALKSWLKESGVERMEAFFSQTILRHRPEVRLRNSQLWALFQQLKAL